MCMEDVRISKQCDTSSKDVSCAQGANTELVGPNPDRVAVTFSIFTDVARGITIHVQTKTGLTMVFAAVNHVADQGGINFTLNYRDHPGIIHLKIVGNGLTGTEVISVVESVLPRE